MKLLITGAFNINESQAEKIKKLGYQIDFIKDETNSCIKEKNIYDGVICNGLFLYQNIKEYRKLKFVQLTSSGVDRVPYQYMLDNNIEVYNAGSVYSIPMAEWVILKILEIYKNSYNFYNQQLKKEWLKNRDLIELNGKRMAIIGYGNVGREIAIRAKAFNVTTIGVGRAFKECSYLDHFCTIDDIESVLKSCDIIVICLPLNSDTLNFFNESKFKVMKEQSILINISRGKVINEKDLEHYIKKGKFRKVALDVFENEPLSLDSSLWDTENVIVTPHNSFVSDGIQNRMFDLVYSNLKKISERY